MRRDLRRRLLSRTRSTYARERELFDRFASKLVDILSDDIERAHLKVHFVGRRTKTVRSYARKVAKDTRRCTSLEQFNGMVDGISDRAGIRVITYLPSDIARVGKVIEREFKVDKRVDVGSDDAQKLGYRSLHYDVRLRNSRTRLPEYSMFKGMAAEIQVRTILQHAWAEIEHEVIYKSGGPAPRQSIHRFATLMGLLEVADREFESLWASIPRERPRGPGRGMS